MASRCAAKSQSNRAWHKCGRQNRNGFYQYAGHLVSFQANAQKPDQGIGLPAVDSAGLSAVCIRHVAGTDLFCGRSHTPCLRLRTCRHSAVHCAAVLLGFQADVPDFRHHVEGSGTWLRRVYSAA